VAKLVLEIIRPFECRYVPTSDPSLVAERSPQRRTRVATFSGRFLGLRLVPAKWHSLASSTSPHQGATQTPAVGWLCSEHKRKNENHYQSNHPYVLGCGIVVILQQFRVHITARPNKSYGGS
jgi:hypothetical protein